MSTAEAIQKKVSTLPPNKQEEVLEFVESIEQQAAKKTGEPYCALRVAASLNLEGPPDWSTRFEEYLHESRMKHGGA